MNKEDILSHVDHTLLKQTSTKEEILKICEEAKVNKVASVCIPPCFVHDAKEYLKDTIPVCTVIGFPNGNTSTKSKIYETKIAIEDGAKEIDMVINVGKLKEKNYNYVQNEITELASICHENSAILKVIIETCLLDDDEIEKMCFVCANSFADYIKTSTGFSKQGANPHVVSIMIDTIKNNNLNLKVKAAGGISSVDDAKNYLEMGVDRLGTSRLIKLLS